MDDTRSLPAVAAASALSAADVARLREEFPILARTTYLVTHSLGPMPRGVREALSAYADAWDVRGVRAWEDSWWDMAAEVADELAPLIGAPAGSVSLHQNVAVALAVALSCFEFTGDRRRILYSETEFPSVTYQLEELARLGAEPVRLGSPDRSFPFEALLGAIDERTRIVVVSRVVYHSAELVDLTAIAARCREVGALLVVDAYQAAGTVPMDLVAEGVDIAVGGSVKFLLGGPGVGYLYVRPGLTESLRPRLTGWMAHERPFAFDAGGQRLRPEGAWRFLGGTPHVPALYAARVGYGILREIGVPAIRERSLALTGRLIAAARERGWRVVTPPDDARRGGSVTLDIADAEGLVKEIGAREILVDSRPRVGLRVGPHFFTTEAEIDRFVEAVASLVGR